MSYEVIARKYRPQIFADVVGQDHVIDTLKNAIANVDVPSVRKLFSREKSQFWAPMQSSATRHKVSVRFNIEPPVPDGLFA